MNWLISFLAGRWLVLAGLVAVLALFAGTYGLGRSHANTRWEARWEARDRAYTDAQAKAQRAADATLARQRQATQTAAEEFARAQTENARLYGVNLDLGRRLRSAIARPAATVPAAATDTSEPQPAAAGVATVAVSVIVEGLDQFARDCARIADERGAQARALIDGWPR